MLQHTVPLLVGKELSSLTVLIAASNKDIAAMNIIGKIQRNLSFIDSGMSFDGFPILRRDNLLMARTESDSIFTSGLDKIPDVDSIIFASRHSSSSGRSTLTVHTPGNPLREAKYGGNPQSLAIADPNKMRAALTIMNSRILDWDSSYQVSLEATHHGPTEMNKPVVFVEIGSGPMQWKDETAGNVVAEAILHAAKENLTLKTAVGFGGGHYAPKFTDLVLEGNLSIGHIFPKHCISGLTHSVVISAFRRTKGPCTLAVIDWKGIRGVDRERILTILSEVGIEIRRI